MFNQGVKFRGEHIVWVKPCIQRPSFNDKTFCVARCTWPPLAFVPLFFSTTAQLKYPWVYNHCQVIIKKKQTLASVSCSSSASFHLELLVTLIYDFFFKEFAQHLLPAIQLIHILVYFSAFIFSLSLLSLHHLSQAYFRCCRFEPNEINQTSQLQAMPSRGCLHYE